VLKVTRDMRRAMIALNNFLRRLRPRRVRPDQLLLLFSSCLQRSACECNVRASLANCRRCGGCVVGRLLDLADELGVQAFMATGGRLAAERANDDGVKAIVAVACPKELSAGLRATFPKPTLLLELSTPNGPCIDTEIDFETVRRAVDSFLREA
jgi:hypothetical protein